MTASSRKAFLDAQRHRKNIRVLATLPPAQAADILTTPEIVRLIVCSGGGPALMEIIEGMEKTQRAQLLAQEGVIYGLTLASGKRENYPRDMDHSSAQRSLHARRSGRTFDPRQQSAPFVIAR